MPSFNDHIVAFRAFLLTEGLTIFGEQAINHGHQITVTDRSTRIPVNFFATGKILVQGKDSPLKKTLTEWANLQQANANVSVASLETPQSGPINRTSRYTTAPSEFDSIREVICAAFPAFVTARSTTQEAEVYRLDLQRNSDRVSVTQFKTGTLFVQGRFSALFDELCDVIDKHINQSFADRAARYLPNDTADAARTFLASPDVENDAWEWVCKELHSEVFNFLNQHDQQTIVSGAGILLALRETQRQLAEFSPVVMPFGKTFEGFVIRLAIHLGLVTEDAIKQSAEIIKIGEWLGEIREGLPDRRRWEFVATSLNDAWQSRNKCMHADPEKPMPIRSLDEATQEIYSILRGMQKAHDVFVTQQLPLKTKQKKGANQTNASQSKSEDKATSTAAGSAIDSVVRFEGVDVEQLAQRLRGDGHQVNHSPAGSSTLWEIKQADLQVFCSAKHSGRVSVKGAKASEFIEQYRPILDKTATPEPGSPEEELFPDLPIPTAGGWIGVDESGKGDVFGPLVIAAVFIQPPLADQLIRLGVRDSKTLSSTAITRLSAEIQRLCPDHMILVVEPAKYNALYQELQNLNRLLAQKHAEAISKLATTTQAARALSDQFGDERLIREALQAQGCAITIEQRPHAEDDVAVAAASILARATFVAWLDQAKQRLGFPLPPGVAPVTVEAGRQIIAHHGRLGLAQYAKLHFRTVREML